MALPVASAPRSNDVAVSGWSALTVRVAWTLLVLGVKVRSDLLREARAHVLLHLEPGTPLAHAEDLATHAVEGFVARARGRAPDDPWPSDASMPLSARWLAAVEASLDDIGGVVFRKHYGDHRGLTWLERQAGLDRSAVDASRAALREVVRGMAIADGLPLEGWPAERLDRLLHRLAAHAPGPCPPALDLVGGCHREHVVACPRCDRTARLLASGVLTVEDLLPPSVGARPSSRVRVLALQLHPDGRRSARRLLEALPKPALSIGDDIALVEVTSVDALAATLARAAELGAPAREHVRGVVLEGPGLFTSHGLAGPLPERARSELGQRSWGAVEGVGELPARLVQPPSSTGWWAAAAAVAVVTVALAVWAATSPRRAPPASEQVRVELVPGRGGVWASFEVPERSFVTVVAAEQGHVRPVLASTRPSDRAPLAVGDGTYRLHVVGEGLLVAVTERPVADLAALTQSAEAEEAPLAALAEALEPSGDVFWRSAR